MLSKHSPLDWTGAVAVILAATIYQCYVIGTMPLPVEFMVANTVLFLFCIVLLVFGSRHPMGIHQSIVLFYVILFGIIPPLELANGVRHWDAAAAVLDYYMPATVLALVGLLTFQAAFVFTGRRALSPLLRPPGRQPALWGLLIASIFATIIVYWYNNFSLVNVFVRGGEEVERIDFGQMSDLVYRFFVLPIPCAALLLYLTSNQRNGFGVLLLLLLFLVANPITGMSRSQAASMYIAVTASLLPLFIYQRMLLPLLMFGGLFLVFPMLGLFRRFSADGLADVGMPSWRFLLDGNFDSFQSLAHIMSIDMVTWGQQLLGVLLFFVPRSVWPDKPVGTGHTLAEVSDLRLSNISANYMTEGYANAGVVGTLLFMAFAGWLVARLDARYRAADATPRFKAQYLLLIGQAFFIMRGDLLSSFAYTIGMMLTIWVINGVASFKFSGR